MKLEKKFLQLIQENQYCTIGSIGKDNTPWVTPLFYAYDQEMNIYWISPKDSRHSKNIKYYPKISFTCFDSHAPKWTGSAAYMTMFAKELSEVKEVNIALTNIFKRLEEPVPSHQEYSSKHTYRTYQAKPIKLWVTGAKKVAGETVEDARIQVNLDMVQQIHQLNDILSFGKKQGKKSGIEPDQIETIIDKNRKTTKNKKP